MTNVAGAYWRGDETKKQLTRIYGISFPKQKELTELNADGNEERGREGEDLSLSKEEEEKLKEKIKELRKRDPFIYR